MENFEKVLLAYDGSEHGRIALRRTLPLLGAGEVEVHLLAVVPLTGAVAAAEGFYTESMYEAERERIENILDEGVTLLKNRGVDAEGHLRAGEPAHQIAKLAEDLAVNLVVVGHQRRGVLARWWQGSVGASLLDRLTCSLLVVQAPGEDEDVAAAPAP
ncbi:UspA domain-containing protein [Salinisphaera shabanensis T35B1]|jgi:nucleotide-binding universal stress UspA family protein|uniref:Stress-related protein n=1 Tax=Salinisphaera shabanensis E1L3A TaxID=1033802 RepID=U2FU11_9GAMM|nr:universal stress protein [Salinisphaera shabanensis]ERJ17873.1 Putative stress-related protein [Salinisphaera shabanensis E1L3A]